MANYLSVTEYLQWLSRARGLTGDMPHLMEHGRFFKPHPGNPFRPKGAKRECFRNAALLAIRDSTLVYVEGYAISIERDGIVIPFPIEHGFCVNRSGEAIETTWHNGLEYFGIPFRTDFVRKTISEYKYYGYTTYAAQRAKLPVREWRASVRGKRLNLTPKP